MKDTRQIILDKALKLFNKVGVENGGMRELAKELDLRVGNITYYFPTKDDLVFALVQQYSTINAALFAPSETMTLYDFLDRRVAIFRNQADYRCLQLSFVHIMERNDSVRESYKETRKRRTDALSDAIELLVAEKYIMLNSRDAAQLLTLVAMVGRLWLSEAQVALKGKSLDEQMRYYLEVFANLFRPYATKKGLADIERFVKSLQTTE